MKSLTRTALIVALASATTGTAALPQRYDHFIIGSPSRPEHRKPDVFKELLRFRVQNHGTDEAFGDTTADVLKQFLTEPDSPYSELRSQPTITKQTWWPAFVDELSKRMAGGQKSVVAALQLQLGLTKARPGLDVVVDENIVRGYGWRGQTPQATANALKARVDADVFRQALQMSGSHYAEAAGTAVALQILKDQMKRNDPSEYTVLAIKPEVFERFMAQQSPQDIRKVDRDYLDAVLLTAMRALPSYEDGGTPDNLPTMYRVARVAAAYADLRGYLTVGGHCRGNEPRPELGVTWPTRAGEPLCFVAATDRAVHDWYRWELLDEVTRRPPPSHESGRSGLLHLVGILLFAIDGMSFIETASEVAAGDLFEEGLLGEEDARLAQQRASRLICGIDP